MGICRTIKHKALFLDRDGVINRAIVKDGKPFSPQSLDELEIIGGVAEALDRLRQYGFLSIVVTNQPDVGRGKQTRETVEEMNGFLLRTLPLDDLFVCYHSGNEDCSCRKPSPGMLLDAAEKWGIDLEKSYLVGDRWSDIEAGIRAGCFTFFIDYGYAERRPVVVGATVDSLRSAVQQILEQENILNLEETS